MSILISLPYNSAGKPFTNKQGPGTGSVGSHEGVFWSGWDFSVPKEDPVLAVADGIVIDYWEGTKDGTPISLNVPSQDYSNGPSGIGNWVTILFNQGEESEFYATYMHLQHGSISNHIQIGDQVQEGDIVGSVGNTGVRAGTHLHFQTGSQTIPYNSSAPLSTVRNDGHLIADGRENYDVEISFGDPDEIIDGYPAYIGNTQINPDEVTHTSDTVGDDKIHAQTINLNASYAGTIDSEPSSSNGTDDHHEGRIDKDWYQITLNGGGSYSIAVNSVNISITDSVFVQLYDSSGTAIKNTEGSYISIDYTVIGSGSQTFYIAVSAGAAANDLNNDHDWRIATGTYGISVTTTGGGTSSLQSPLSVNSSLAADASAGALIDQIDWPDFPDNFDISDVVYTVMGSLGDFFEFVGNALFTTAEASTIFDSGNTIDLTFQAEDLNGNVIETYQPTTITQTTSAQSNQAPTITGNNSLELTSGQTIQASDLFQQLGLSFDDADGNTVVLQLNDFYEGQGHFEYYGQSLAGLTLYAISLNDLDNLTYVTGSQAGSNSFTIEVFDDDNAISNEFAVTADVVDSGGGDTGGGDTGGGGSGNQSPVAINDSGRTDEDHSTTIYWQGTGPNDDPEQNDYDPEDDPLTVTHIDDQSISVGQTVSIASGARVTLNNNGTFSYDPDGEFDSLDDGQQANDSFTYTISDGQGNTDIATVSVQIDGEDDDSASHFLSWRIDGDFTAHVEENSPGGTLVGTFTVNNYYDPNASFQYTLLDDAGDRFEIIGNQLFVKEGANLDYEEPSIATNSHSHIIHFQVTDSHGEIFTTSTRIYLDDVEDDVVVPPATGVTPVAVGDAFLVNEYTDNNQWHQSVTTLLDGSFIVTWDSSGQDGYSEGIYGRHYGADGGTIGDEFRINVTPKLPESLGPLDHVFH